MRWSLESIEIPGRGTAKRNISTLIAARVCMLAIVLIGVSLSQWLDFGIPSTHTTHIYQLIAGAFAFTGISAYWIRHREPTPSVSNLQAIFDILLVSGLISFTDPLKSPFVFLYLPLVLTFSLLFPLRIGVRVVLVSGLSYILFPILLEGTGNGYLSPDEVGTLVFHGVGLVLALFGVFLVTGVLSQRLHLSVSLIEESQRAVRELTDRYQVDRERLQDAEETLARQDRFARILVEERSDSVKGPYRIDKMVGESLVLQKVFHLIERVSQTDASILISGESGTGKELVARAIHSQSERRKEAFVPVNCGAIPEALIESEFFGHKKGSFTGAIADSPGFFRQASSGTLFLDEIGELPLAMQAKLLRALQEKTIHPVGGGSDVPVDARIIAATNRNLKEEVAKGRFREDLYFRLNVISIPLPPLRDRKEDVPLLIGATLSKLLPPDKAPVIPPASMQLLMSYAYPGNVRELENIIERAVVLGGEVILPEHLPDSVREGISPRTPAPSHDSPETQIIIDESLEFPIQLDAILSDVERKYLLLALGQSKGVRKKAADLLGINFRSLRYRLQKYDLNDGE